MVLYMTWLGVDFMSLERSGIFTYDGLKNGGFPIRESKANEKTHLTGKSILVPGDFQTKIVVFHL